MRQLLRKLGFGRVTRLSRRLRKTYDRRFGAARLKRRLAATSSRRIVIGSGSKDEPGWIPTQVEFLDLLKPDSWDDFFHPESIDAILAEHVWEHLYPDEGLAAARTCHKYLKPGGYLRIAVPDGLHPSPAYHEWVRVGGASPMQIANDHRVLFTYHTVRALFEHAGFRVQLYEYFDEAGAFHCLPWDEKAGKIWRSKRFDARNRGGELVYTSIILDAFKDAVPAGAAQSAPLPGMPATAWA